MIRSLFLLATAVALASCVGSQKFRKIDENSKATDRSVVFTETTRYDERRALSAPNAEEVATRVPAPAAVDVDSSLEIRLNRGLLSFDTPAPDAETKAEASRLALRSRRDRFVIVADRYAVFLEARARAIASWNSGRTDFDVKKAAFDNTTTELLNDLKNVFEDDGIDVEDEPEYAWLYENSDLRGVGNYVDRELTRLNRQLDEIQEMSDQATFELRIEAFLSRPGATESTAVHVEGYDDLNQLQVRRFDRSGINLSPEQRAALIEAVATSQELADALNRVRQGEADLSEALANTRSALLRKIADWSRRARKIQADLKLSERFSKIQAATNTFIAEVKGSLNQLSQQAQDAARGAIDTAIDGVNQLELITKIVDLVDRLDDLDDATPQQIVGFASALNGVATELTKKSFNDIADELQELGTSIRNEFVGVLPSEPEAAAIVQRAWKSSELELELRDLAAQITAIRELGSEVVAFAKPASLPDIPPTSEGTVARSWPVDSAPNTTIDLTAVPRKPGDRLSIRTTLLSDRAELQSSVATFDIDAFGWRAEFEPSVVLARPDRVANGRDDGFSFAPSVSWMNHWKPRPEDDGTLASIFRFLDPSIGPHATFLNFDNDDSVEIGLGGTVAFFDNILQVGAGYNLMADGPQDGEFYYFVGSSLIPLLQRLQSDSD